MALLLLIVLLVSTNLIVSHNVFSFDLTLNVDAVDNHFLFVETTNSNIKHSLPTVIMLDNEHNQSIVNSSYSSSAKTYHLESDEHLRGFATVIHDKLTDKNLLFAMVQLLNGSFYDISSPISIQKSKRKRSLSSAFIVRSKESIIEQAHVTIKWNNIRQRRYIEESEFNSDGSVIDEQQSSGAKKIDSSTAPSTSVSVKNKDMTTISTVNDTGSSINSSVTATKTKAPTTTTATATATATTTITTATKPQTTPKPKTTTKKPIPKKTRHLYLEMVALVDSLVTNDFRALLNKTELEAIEILKLYYIHIFLGVEQLYRQSLIHENIDVHIRLTKIIFATNKNRLPWELYKNVSSLTENYRKSPNNVELRPNITLNLLKSLHQAYKDAKYDERYFKNGADHVVTFTRMDLINGAGLAYVSGTCLPLFKYSIVQEDLNSFSVTLTVAHELGHNLGFTHDEIQNKCFDPRFRYIMSPKNMNTPDRQQVPYFSECSIQELNKFITDPTLTCWKNKIISTKNDTKFEKLRNLTSMYLGQIINVHEQCQLQYGTQSVPFISVAYSNNNNNYTLYEEDFCDQLKCFKTLDDEFMYWQDGAFDGTPCGENHVCHQKKCVSTNQKIKNKPTIPTCPYGDLFLPIQMLNLPDKYTTGNMLCSDALNLLRSRGMNVTYLCYESSIPYYRLCCEECKKHLIPECGDQNGRCPMFSQYCDNEYARINGVSPKKLCPYTCGQCTHLPSPVKTTTMTTPMATTIETTSSAKEKKVTSIQKISSTTIKPRQYTKPKRFDKYTCIDSADCSQLVKVYSKLNKKVKNWCTEYSTMVEGRYFAEICPKYCSLCNITSECDQHKLCRNNGTCIKDINGTYQCLCSTSKSYYGTLCEHRQTCLDKPCSSKTEYCIQTQGENYVCLSKEDKEKVRVILNGKN